MLLNKLVCCWCCPKQKKERVAAGRDAEAWRDVELEECGKDKLVNLWLLVKVKL